jgi:hypothetical protein
MVFTCVHIFIYIFELDDFAKVFDSSSSTRLDSKKKCCLRNTSKGTRVWLSQFLHFDFKKKVV